MEELKASDFAPRCH